MPFSPRILRGRFSSENKPELTLEIRHNFPREQPQEEAVDYHEVKRDIIARAEARAKQIIDQANKQAENNAQKLAEKAREEGYRQGYREALEQARNEAEEIRSQARKVLQQAEEQRAKILDSLEEEILLLSLDIAEKIIGQKLTMEPESVMAIAREAVQLVKNRDTVTIFHNPADLEIFEQYREDLQKLLPAHASLVFISDEIISPGGCIVETEHGRVEATLESRREAVLESLGLGRNRDDS